jgi:hypothetical protein
VLGEMMTRSYARSEETEPTLSHSHRPVLYADFQAPAPEMGR